jgi:hypothetical protein
MGILSKTGNFLGHIFNVRVDKWVGVTFLKNTAGVFLSAGKELLKVQKSKNPEDFDEAVERLSLTKEELKNQSYRYKLFAFIFLSLALLVLMYSLYLFTHQNKSGSIMSLAISLYVLTQAFRYHFWHFQIERNQLGSSMKEWAQYLFSINKLSRRT